MSPRRVLLVAGSLRAGSYTTRLLVTAGNLVPEPFQVELVDQIRRLPHYDADLDGDDPPEVVRVARSAVADAAALIISTPEYNGAIPGGLKNWVDWLTRPMGAHVLVGKPIAIVGGSPSSKGAAGPVTWLRTTLGYLGSVVVGEPVAVPKVADEIDAGGTVSETVVEQLRGLVDALVASADAGHAAA
jgi:NAD(P)H-dependent FMN reductase